MNPFKKAYELIAKHPVKRLAWATLYDLDTDCRCATGVMAFESGMEGAFDECGSLVKGYRDFDFISREVEVWATAQGFTALDLELIERLNDFYSDDQMEREARYTWTLRQLRRLGAYDEAQLTALRTAYVAVDWRMDEQSRVIRETIEGET